MRIKYSKYKNTGLIFELLVKQISSDTLSRKDSAAVSLIKKYFTGKTPLTREFKLYEFILKNRGVSQMKAENIVSTIIEVSRKIDAKTLKKQKYDLIKEVKDNYNLEEFFAIKVRDYKPLAALYCLLEAQNAIDVINPDILVSNKITILEHLTSSTQDEETAKDTLIEEYSKYDKDLKLLTFKILLEKFNNNYKDLLPEQKNILKEFITSVNSTTRLRNVVNEELEKIASEVTALKDKVKDDVVKIKLEEVSKSIKPVSNKEKISDAHLVNLMQFYELINEFRNL